MELVPHIPLNPSFNIDMLEHLEPDLNATRWSKHLTFLKLVVNENFNHCWLDPRKSRRTDVICFSEHTFLVGSPVER